MGNKITLDQLIQRLKEANNILVVTKKLPSVGYLAAGLAASNILRQFNKNTIFVHADGIPMNIGFLQPENSISPSAETLRNFIISVSRDKVKKFSYNKSEKGYDLSLTPAHNAIIAEEDLEYSKGDFNVDLVVALGVGEKSEIHEVISDHPQLMEDVPMINVLTAHQHQKMSCDCWQMHDAASLGEMIYELSCSLNIHLDRVTANAMLTSMVDFTNHFRHQTMAQTLHVAGSLIERGADLGMIAEQLAMESPGEEASKVPKEVVEALIEDKSEDEVASKLTSINKGGNQKKTLQPRSSSYVSVGDDKHNKLQIGKQKLAGQLKRQKEDKEHRPEEVTVRADGSVQLQSDIQTAEAVKEESQQAAGVSRLAKEGVTSEASTTPSPSGLNLRQSSQEETVDGGINRMPVGSDVAASETQPTTPSPSVPPKVPASVGATATDQAIDSSAESAGQYDTYMKTLETVSAEPEKSTIKAPETQTSQMTPSTPPQPQPSVSATPPPPTAGAVKVNDYYAQQAPPPIAKAPASGAIPVPSNISTPPATAVNPGAAASNYATPPPATAPPIASTP